MNVDRLLREVEARLAGLAQGPRDEVLDALREEIARERRYVEPELTVEAERRRRVEAETLREVLEAINRPGRLDEILDEVLKQLMRLVTCDSSLVALLEGDGSFRALAARGLAETYALTGRRFRSVYCVTANYFFQEHQKHNVEDFGIIAATMDEGLSVTIALSLRDLVMGGTFRSTPRGSAPSGHHLSGEPVSRTG
jgi:hypothetical protein